MKDIPRRRAAFLARREDALGRASAGLWECRLRDEALEWTNGIYHYLGTLRSDGSRKRRRQCGHCTGGMTATNSRPMMA